MSKRQRLMMPDLKGRSRKRMYVTSGGTTIQQHYVPRNFREEVKIAIDHSFDAGMLPVTAEEATFLRDLAA